MKVLILAALLLFQSPDGDDAPEPGKPASCDNFHGTPAAHKCACGKAMHHDCTQPEPSVRNDAKCATNCRPDHCHCLSQCTT